jgi:hypothetical protein
VLVALRGDAVVGVVDVVIVPNLLDGSCHMRLSTPWSSTTRCGARVSASVADSTWMTSVSIQDGCHMLADIAKPST